MNALKGLIKLIAAIVVLSGIIAMPAMALDTNPTVDQTSRETAVRKRFANNTLNGVVKARELRGQVLTETQRKKVYDIAFKSAGELIEVLKETGLFDEYYTQLHDKEIIALDKQTFSATTIEEIQRLMYKQLDLIRTKYPRLYAWISSSEPAARITTQMLKDIMVVID